MERDFLDPPVWISSGSGGDRVGVDAFVVEFVFFFLPRLLRAVRRLVFGRLVGGCQVLSFGSDPMLQ